jgi:hypothetical protein
MARTVYKALRLAYDVVQATGVRDRGQIAAIREALDRTVALDRRLQAIAAEKGSLNLRPEAGAPERMLYDEERRTRDGAKRALHELLEASGYKESLPRYARDLERWSPDNVFELVEHCLEWKRRQTVARETAGALERAVTHRPLPALPERARSHEDALVDLAGRIFEEGPYAALATQSAPALQGALARMQREAEGRDLSVGHRSLVKMAAKRILDDLWVRRVAEAGQDDQPLWNLTAWTRKALAIGLVSGQGLQAAVRNPWEARRIAAMLGAMTAAESAARRGDRRSATQHAGFAIGTAEPQGSVAGWIRGLGLDPGEVAVAGEEIRRRRRDREWIRKEMQALVDVPVLQRAGTRFGIENELDGLLPDEMRQEMQRLARRGDGGSPRPWVDDWSVVPDDSVPGGSEIQSPILLWPRDVPQVLAVMAAAAAVDAVIACDECGLHVHVSVKGLGLPELTSLAAVVWYWEPVIRTLASEHRSRRGWSRDTPGNVIAGLIDALAGPRPEPAWSKNNAWWLQWYGLDEDDPLPRREKHDDPGTRSRGLNLHAVRYLGTVEFRFADATLDPQRVVDLTAMYLKLVWLARRHPWPWRGRGPLAAAPLRDARWRLSPPPTRQRVVAFLKLLGLPRDCAGRLFAFARQNQGYPLALAASPKPARGEYRCSECGREVFPASEDEVLACPDHPQAVVDTVSALRRRPVPAPARPNPRRIRSRPASRRW